MIYSDDIQKVCGLCVHAELRDGDERFCMRLKKNVQADNAGCRHYKYDILKRGVRRRRPLNTDFSEEDFKL